MRLSKVDLIGAVQNVCGIIGHGEIKSTLVDKSMKSLMSLASPLPLKHDAGNFFQGDQDET